MKIYFLFSGLNMNIIIQKKVSEKCTFYGWYFKNKGIKHVNVKTVVRPPPIKISGYAPALIKGVGNKSWFESDTWDFCQWLGHESILEHGFDFQIHRDVTIGMKDQTKSGLELFFWITQNYWRSFINFHTRC